ncbi:MAG: phosphatase PAP2 family protein [Candidatus Eremiobacteraeota bacterium]|nr:phosphatase PAP2 family protein [Candidatus Eremiobacteraeota bacterium]
MITSKIVLYIAILCALYLLNFNMAFSADFNYPDNFRQSREMVLDEDHHTTRENADREVYKYFFRPGEKFKIRQNPEKIDKKGWKRHFKDRMNLWQIALDRLKPENIFDFYPLTDQLNTPQKIITAVSMGHFMDNDRKLYTDIEGGMAVSKFWDQNGSWLSSIADGFAEVAVAGALSLTGNKKNQQVAQMLMEAALSLRVVYIKRVLGVTRPSELVANIGASLTDDAFPSGHTSVAFSMATILGEAYDIKWITYPLALLSGLSRIQQNTHWLSDVFAGGLLGHLEARQILYRHGYIPSDEIAESHVWDNTKIDLDGSFRLYYDTYANLEGSDRILDRVGRLVWRWSITQKISPDILVQVNYHWRGQVPSIVSYNSDEDVLLNPRILAKVSNRIVIIAGYTYSKIQFNDLARTPHHPERGELPPGLDYIDVFGKKTCSAELMYKLSPDYYIKPGYSYSTYTYGTFLDLYSRGGRASVEIATSPERKKPTNILLSYSNGIEDAANPAYSFNRQILRAKLTQNLGKNFKLKASYINEKRKYNNWHSGFNKPDATWEVGGFEIQRKFSDSWNGELGYYRRTLASDITGWPYKKDIYFLQMNNRF